MALFPFLRKVSVAALEEDPAKKIDSIVKQLDEWSNQLNQLADTYKSETHIQMNEWFGSYKQSSTYTSLPGSTVTINFDDWEAYDWYWENVIFTDVGTCYVRLYNVTDSEAVSDTETSTSVTGEANAVYTRKGPLTKYKGTKVFKTQIKLVNWDSDPEKYANCMTSRMVFRIESGN